MKWKITGASKSDGSEMTLMVDAADAIAAQRIADTHGILVETINPTQEIWIAGTAPAQGRFSGARVLMFFGVVAMVLGGFSGSEKGRDAFATGAVFVVISLLIQIAGKR